MTQAIIFTNENGGVSVCYPTSELPIEEVLAKDCPIGAIIVEDTSLPQDAGAQFFDAWELVDGVVTVNLEKAKNVTKARLRLERQPFLDAQDILFQRAFEMQSDTSAIVAEKNRLRDITKQVDSETTLEGLLAIKVTL